MGVATHVCRSCGLKVRIWTDDDPFYCRNCKHPEKIVVYDDDDFFGEDTLKARSIRAGIDLSRRVAKDIVEAMEGESNA